MSLTNGTMNVNDRIQLVRFYARFVIAILAMTIFSYIVHMMLTASEEMTASSKDLLNILIGSFIPILAGISRYYFESGGDLHQEEEKNAIPPPIKSTPTGEEDEPSFTD
tara:strand:- start:180 stop:506 length:327 start_codon:yes stop_codon:yes gene_type:complete